MTAVEVELVKKSWAVVERLNPVVAGNIFYNRLFEIAPQLNPMFKTPIDGQSKKLLWMISYVIKRLNRLESVAAELGTLAKNHVKYGVKEEHYQIVGAALLWTLERALDTLWTPEVASAWQRCYHILSAAMIAASKEVITS